MRKGIFTLAELVRKIMGKEPSAGDIFIFLSKDRRNIKILHHDTGGYVLYWKKLDKDRFLLPVFCKASHRYEIGWEKLVVLLQGTVRKELLVGYEVTEQSIVRGYIFDYQYINMFKILHKSALFCIFATWKTRKRSTY